MADIYDRGRALAVRMLAPRARGGKGAVASITIKSSGSYSPGQAVIPGETTVSVSMVRTRYGLRDIDGQRVQATDARLLVSPQTEAGADTPQASPGDSVTFADGTTFSVVACRPWNYAGLTCGFEIQGRV